MKTTFVFAIAVAMLLTAGLVFAQDTTLTITNTGKVGIGTTSPTELFHIRNNGDRRPLFVENASNFGAFISSSGNPGYTLDIQNTGTGGGLRIDVANHSNPSTALDVYMSGNAGNAAKFQLANPSNSNPAIEVYTGGLGNAGYFQISNNSSSAAALVARTSGSGYAGYFYGNVCATGNIGSCSDMRYKKQITPLMHSLKKVQLLNGISYQWRTDEFPEKSFKKGNQIGLIAQDVEKVYPEVVLTDKDGYKSVDYSKLVAVLIEAVKEQQKQIDELRTAMKSITELR